MSRMAPTVDETIMKRYLLATASLLLLGILPEFAFAQGIGGQTGVGTGAGAPQTGIVPDRDAGLTQSGQISSDAGIQRDEGAFIGRGSAEHPRSVAAFATTSVNAGFTQSTAITGGGITGTGRQNNLIGAASLGGGRNNFNNQLGLNSALGGIGGNQLGAGNQFSAQATQAPIRYQLRYAEAIPSKPFPVANTPASVGFQSRVGRIPVFATNRDVAIAMEGRTLILRGTVASERERRLMERMAELEPGISFVKNELRLVSEGVSKVESPTGPAIATSR